MSGFWRFWQKGTAAAALLVVGVLTLDHATRSAPIPASACRFIAYYEALEDSDQLGLPERVVYSWMLAGD
ncbi:MAG: hypothetical protein GY953_49785 [bacterium]|nr:hypothetical protein [bacterium]